MGQDEDFEEARQKATKLGAKKVRSRGLIMPRKLNGLHYKTGLLKLKYFVVILFLLIEIITSRSAPGNLHRFYTLQQKGALNIVDQPSLYVKWLSK